MSFNGAPGGVTAATPRLIASIAEGERAETVLAAFPVSSNGDNLVAGASDVEQPVRLRISPAKTAIQRISLKKFQYWRTEALCLSVYNRFLSSSRFTRGLSRIFLRL